MKLLLPLLLSAQLASTPTTPICTRHYYQTSQGAYYAWERIKSPNQVCAAAVGRMGNWTVEIEPVDNGQPIDIKAVKSLRDAEDMAEQHCPSVTPSWIVEKN